MTHTTMKTQAPPLYTLPTPAQQHSTLLTVKRGGLALAVFFLLAGGWRLQMNQVEANTLKQRNAESLTRSVITARTKPGASSQQLVLPDAAVIRDNNLDHVFVETAPAHFELRPVRLGDREGDVRQILDGLKAGEKVVVEGGFHLNNERLRKELE